MSSPTSTVRSESGSMPLSLIVVIAAAGLMSVLVISVISAQQQVGFDRDFAHALPLADAGVAVAQTRLSNNGTFTSAQDGTDKRFREFAVGEQSEPETDTLGGQEFAWFVERVSQSRWEVVSSSVVDETERVIVSTLEEQSDPFFAAFTDQLIAMTGGNAADSYSSTTGEWCTRLGVVGSNDDVDFSGQSTSGSTCDRPSQRTVDRVDLYNWDANPATDAAPDRPGGERCDPRDHANCQQLTHNGDVFEAPRTIDEALDLATDEAVAFITDALEACDNVEPLKPFVASQDLPEDGGVRVLSPAPKAAEAVATGNTALPGSHYCYESLDFDQNIKLHPDASAAKPVIIFVKKEVLIRGGGNNGVHVGCVDCDAGVDTPEAAALRIFVETGDVAVGNHALFAGVMHAPRASCAGSGGNAQVHFYGSLVCREIANQGGWRFHYDDALNDVRNGQFATAGWREEVPASP